MYSYEWDRKTKGYKLTTQTGKFVASEIRPVFADELQLLNADRYFKFDHSEIRPLMWAKQNSYFYDGEECAKAKITEEGNIEFLPANPERTVKITPCDIEGMVARNSKIMDSLIADTKKRIKEMYDEYKDQCDVTYIGFSGGKDSSVLLDLCHQVLPISVPVIFSDTDMELPSTYRFWDIIQKKYDERPFVKVKADRTALENWALFGPPSQNLRWCCAVHKSTPAILYLRELSNIPCARTLAYVGVRADESVRRSSYDDVGDGLKNQNQINAMPILSWGTQELFLYIFSKNLIINDAYRKGLPRVGCLLCPMSSDRQINIIRRLYPDSVSNFASVIKGELSRDFSSDEDFEKFIFLGGWHARQSGVTLKNVIPAPTEKKDKSQLYYNFQPVKLGMLTEWLKTLGKLQSTDATDKFSSYELFFRGSSCQIDLTGTGEFVSKLDCNVSDPKELKIIAKLLKNVLHKSLGCVNCRACESECPTGALTFKNGIHVDGEKCIHCLKCHAPQDGCMRYFSKRYAGGTTMNISGINKYMTFGLKEEWVQILADETDNFRSTSALGNRMIPSAITWFREAKLISDSTMVKPTRLLDVGRSLGFDSDLLWSLIWISLVNNSPLIKWYVCNTQIEELTSVDTLNEKLAIQVNSDSVRKGALQSLTGTIKNSPIGKSDAPIVQVEQKGVRVLGLKRVPKSIEPLAVLYSLYLMATVAARTAFTLSEMMTADFESPYISPLVAFGMNVEELKGQCMGISSIYPDYLACSFTLGLEEIKVFPKEKTLDDVIGLILGE